MLTEEELEAVRSIGSGLHEIADAIINLSNNVQQYTESHADSMSELGLNKANDQRGAIEVLAQEIKEGTERISEAMTGFKNQ